MQQPDLNAAPDLETLAAFLASERAPPEAFSLSELDGLLTAVMIGPETILPSEWLQFAWGGDGDEPVFDSQEEAGAVIGAMMARCNEIVRGLDVDPPTYEPFFWEGEDGAPVIDEWCYGFMAGVGMRAEKWARFMNSNKGVLLLPIMAHVPELQDEDPIDPAMLPDFDPRLAIPALVAAMHGYWRQRRAKKTKHANVVRVTEIPLRVKPGPDEPCPCGSGVKYKRCCAATGATSR
jgi:uncharacterized protein